MSAPAVQVVGERRISVDWAAGEPGAQAGWQIFDPDTDLFLAEGTWTVTGADGRVRVNVELPREPGRYRVYVSTIDDARGWSYQRGARFLLLDAEVGADAVRIVQTSLTSLPRLWRKRLPSAVHNALTLPLTALWRNRSLIRSMVWRDIQGRYRGSAGGLLWAVLSPLLLMGTYFFVFAVVLRARFEGDPTRTGFALYFLAGMLPWLAFSEAVARAPSVVLEHRNFVRKLVFPVEILPANLVIAGLVTQAVATTVFLFALAVLRGALPAAGLWMPVLLVPQVVLTMGLCWFAAALGAFLRDLGQISGFVLTLWFFLTPICYPESSLPAHALSVLGHNPVYWLVRGYRAILLESAPPPVAVVWKLWAVSAFAFFSGYAFFHKLRRSFADVI